MSIFVIFFVNCFNVCTDNVPLQCTYLFRLEFNSLIAFYCYLSTDKVSLVAEYPSNRDFRAYISHSTPDFDHKEAVMAIHLNNSHLIHSRMTWSPDLLSRVSTSLEEKSVSAGYKAMEQWGLINQAIEDEVSQSHLKSVFHVLFF